MSDAAEPAIGESGLCACCDDHAIIVFIECVLGPVCADCKVQLRWAQARLKQQKLLFCRPDMDWHEAAAPAVLDLRTLRDGGGEL
jgi:hypothetical protein